MTRNFLLLAVLGAAIVQPSPAQAGKAPLPPPSHVEVVVTEPELQVDPIKIGGLGALATGAVLMERGIREASEASGGRRVGELRDQLAGFDAGARFQQALEARLGEAGLAADVEVRASERGDAPLAEGEPAHVLSMQLRHAMDANFETLTITADARLLDRSLHGAGRFAQKWKGNNAYADNRLAYGVRFRLPHVGGNGASEDAARWAALGADELRAMLGAGLDELAAMVTYDLTPAGLADRGIRKQMGFVQFDGEPYRGRMVQVDGRRWLRDRVGLQAAHAIDGTSHPYSAKAATDPAPALPTPAEE